jgi:hypothetical protein
MANSQLHGIILDLADVVPSAIAAASALGLAERSKALAGDFFTYVPEVDIYLLAHILHDWNDGEAVHGQKPFASGRIVDHDEGPRLNAEARWR